jgi:hypothetical protein
MRFRGVGNFDLAGRTRETIEQPIPVHPFSVTQGFGVRQRLLQLRICQRHIKVRSELHDLLLECAVAENLYLTPSSVRRSQCFAKIIFVFRIYGHSVIAHGYDEISGAPKLRLPRLLDPLVHGPIQLR